MQTTFCDFVGASDAAQRINLTETDRRDLGCELEGLTCALNTESHAVPQAGKASEAHPTAMVTCFIGTCIADTREATQVAGTFTKIPVNGSCIVHDTAHQASESGPTALTCMGLYCGH